MNIAYVRVSTVEQNEERQIEGLKKYNIEKWFVEKISGKNTNRPELKNMIDFAREGDTIYIHSLDRLARSTKDLLEIVETLQNKKVHLVSNKENIDTSTATGKLMLTMIGAIAEFERANMLERQREGIEIAKSQGKYKGRPAKITDKFIYCAKAWSEGKMQLKEAIAESGVSEPTFFRQCKKLGIKKIRKV